MPCFRNIFFRCDGIVPVGSLQSPSNVPSQFLDNTYKIVIVMNSLFLSREQCFLYYLYGPSFMCPGFVTTTGFEIFLINSYYLKSLFYLLICQARICTVNQLFQYFSGEILIVLRVVIASPFIRST